MQRLATFALILFCLASASATPKQDNLAKQFVGAWRLISVEGQPAGAPGFYEHATGMIIYDPSGWVSVQIANKGDRKPFVKGVASGTPAEKAAAFDSYLAYYGTYTVDARAKTITHHVEDYSYPGRRGTDNVRRFEFHGNDRIVLTPVADGKGGVVARKDSTHKLVWERIK